LGPESVILASGGAVLRPAAFTRAGFQVLLVHRPRYDDWSLPKGKDEPGEDPQAAAVREVWEEAGQHARIISPLGQSSYHTLAGPKVVRWFAMKALGAGQFEPNGEVDRIAWVEPEEAAGLLNYSRDRELVANLDGKALLTTGSLFLVRHAAAGDRTAWTDDDRLRPLTGKGAAQAKGIAGWLKDRDIERIITSPYVRCLQTVEPLAHKLGIEMELDESLAEAAGGKAARQLVGELAGTNAVLCSHGDVIPALLDWMVRRGMELRSPFDCKKGSTWEVAVTAGEFTSARYWPPPSA
jgi:8-oxo-dGTP diphosphatase